LTAQEIDPGSKAAAEMKQLYAYTSKRLGLDKARGRPAAA
jgi:hypothetical protein